MTTTIALQNKEGYITGVASNIGERTRKGAVAMKKRAGMSVRKMVAIVLFAVGAVFALGSTVNLALARVRKASRIAQVGHFRLLNIYNAIKASHPGFINAMNRATTGLASWYGGIFQGRKTAMGTTYNMNDMTAAHRTLPLGTWVRVTNQENDRSVVVQVTDRGPYVANRIMDLSYAAAEQPATPMPARRKSPCRCWAIALMPRKLRTMVVQPPSPLLFRPCSRSRRIRIT